MNPPPNSRPFLITGGAGFIGSHLADRLLAAGATVRVLDDFSTGRRENVDAAIDLRVGDVADPATVADAARDVAGIFHLAAIASVARGNQDWTGSHRVNQGGAVAVLDAARGGGGIPVVYASSAAVYGDAGDGPISETRAPAPRSAYGVDKLGSELHASVGRLIHGVPSLGLRPFNVYGPRQDPASPYSGVISVFADLLARGLPITLHGDGGQSRDFVHVDDVVAHFIAGMTRLREGAALPPVLNVCTGRAVTVRELALLLGAAAIDLRHGPARAGDIRHSLGSPDAAIAELGVRAAIRLEDGLARLPPCRPGNP